MPSLYFILCQQPSLRVEGLPVFLSTAPLPALAEIGQQVPNELRKAEIASVTAGVVVFEESDCKQERELTRKGQEPFRLKTNFGLQTKNVN